MRQYHRYAYLIALAVGLATTPAQAQTTWLFGPEKNSIDDKSVVQFPQKYRPGDIVVSFGDRRLYHVTKSGQAMSYPIAVPRAQSRWSGVERVTYKKVDPSWTPTARMRRENPKLPAFVPGGDPLNPLGVRALYLGNTLYRIHGTDAPWTIGKNVSKGCVRMHNAHVIELYDRVKVGARVIATWDRYKTEVVASETSSSDDIYEKVFGSRN
ncbi:MAG: L,D-transpeptidase [Hyphomicrobiaceae bacterium]